MNLHEYQAKQLFARYGLPAPVGYACTTPREAEEAASKIGAGPWVVKCQVHAGGRGKAGGVKVVKSKEEIRAFAENWLGKRLVTYQTDANGQPVNQGAWYCSQHHFREVTPFGAALRYAGRPASASPAVGYMSVHQKQQQDLVNDALNVD